MNDRDPWQVLDASWPWVKIRIVHAPDRWGQTVWINGKPHIELAHDLGHIQQRCTLAHELHHLEIGQPCTPYCGGNERTVVEATARWLLPDIDALGGHLADQDIDTAARELEVTRQVLIDRLTTLSADEETRLGALLGTATDAGAGRAAHGLRRFPATVHTCFEGAGRPALPR